MPNSLTSRKYTLRCRQDRYDTKHLLKYKCVTGYNPKPNSPMRRRLTPTNSPPSRIFFQYRRHHKNPNSSDLDFRRLKIYHSSTKTVFMCVLFSTYILKLLGPIASGTPRRIVFCSVSIFVLKERTLVMNGTSL